MSFGIMVSPYEELRYFMISGPANPANMSKGIADITALAITDCFLTLLPAASTTLTVAAQGL